MTALVPRRLGAVALGMLMVAFLSASDSPKLVFFASQAQAEKDLKDFGRSNPSCELWSNWQKVCSRIGDTIYCGVDVTNRVRPSKTFCVGSWDGVDTLANMSQFRFCKKRGELYYSSSRRFAVCEEYLSGRPFDGRDSLRAYLLRAWSGDRKRPALELKNLLSQDIIVRSSNRITALIIPNISEIYK
jgi:hypothetical protein